MSDIVIIGGGVIGLLAAYELRGRGLEVLLLERDQPGRQASWASAGILSKTVRGSTDPVEALRAASAPLYPDLVAALRDETGIDVQYLMNGVVVPARDPDEAASIRADTQRMLDRGLPVELVEGAALREAEPALSPRIPLARLEPGGNIDNRRLCQALELACRHRGVDIQTGAVVAEVLNRNGRVSGVRTLTGDVAASRVVVAAGSWSGELKGCDPVVPVVPQRGQILALTRRDVPLRRVISTLTDPYIVPRIDGRVVVGATREFAGYEASLTARGVAWLLQSAMDLVPALANAPIQEMWTGFRPLSLDGRPAIGPGHLDGLFFATGHGPSGIAPAPATIKLLAAHILAEPLPVAGEPFDPRRFPSTAVREPRLHVATARVE
jgi:glycine oxidase